MAPTIASTVVDRPAADVFAYATDPARFHEWQQGVIDGHLDRPGPPQVGTKCLTTRRIGGARRGATPRPQTPGLTITPGGGGRIAPPPSPPPRLPACLAANRYQTAIPASFGSRGAREHRA